MAIFVGMWPASLAGNHGYAPLAQFFFFFFFTSPFEFLFLPEIFLIKSGYISKSTVEQMLLNYDNDSSICSLESSGVLS